MDYGYTIVGHYESNTCTPSGLGEMSPISCYPIFLPNHKTSFRGVSDLNEMFNLFKAPIDITHFPHGEVRTPRGLQRLHIILPVLYQLKWVHGELDLYKLLNLSNYFMFFLDENEKDYFPERHLGMGGPPKDTNNTNALSMWLGYNHNLSVTKIKSNRDIIIEIEQKYPGLFKPIFINPSVPKPLSPKTPSHSPPQIVVSNKSKKKQSKPPRDVALTKKYRNQRSKQTFPDWWEVKSE